MFAQGDSLTDSLFRHCRRFYIDVRLGLLSGDTRTIFPWHPCKNRLGHATAHGRPPNIKAYACPLVLVWSLLWMATKSGAVCLLLTCDAQLYKCAIPPQSGQSDKHLLHFQNTVYGHLTVYNQPSTNNRSTRCAPPI